MATWTRGLAFLVRLNKQRLRKISLTGLIGIVLIMIIVTLAIAAPLIAPHDPNFQSLTSRLKPPGWSNADGTVYLLGTDQLGRDILSRIIYGSRISISVGFVCVLFSSMFGTVLGLLAGFFRGAVETIIMRAVDLIMSLPFILLALSVIGITGPGLKNLIVVIVFTNWARYARVQFGQVLSYSQREFVQAAEALGGSNRRILFRHLLPNVLPTTVVLATLDLGFIILLESGLSFLGLGVPPSIPTWGNMLAEGRAYLSTAWWLGTFPGFAIMFTVLGFNLLGDWVRDKMDPTLRV